MVSEARNELMAWMETDYSKHTQFRWKIKWRLEHLGTLGIMGDTVPLTFLWNEVSLKTVGIFLLFLLISQDKPIYLLDDPLAAVDAHVAMHLFQYCIMGLLQNKTRILCTHHTKFLTAADLVLVMEHGSVVHCGPPEQILQASIMSQISHNVSHQGEKEKASKEEAEDLCTKDEDSGLVKEEEKEVGMVKLHVYAAYWSAIGHCLATSILVSLLLMQGEGIIMCCL